MKQQKRVDSKIAADINKFTEKELNLITIHIFLNCNNHDFDS